MLAPRARETLRRRTPTVRWALAYLAGAVAVVAAVVGVGAVG